MVAAQQVLNLRDADIRAFIAAGINVSVGIGGSNGGVRCLTQTHANQLVASTQAHVNTYGINGINLDIEHRHWTAGAEATRQQRAREKRLDAALLGKEVLIALQRLGVETIAVDRYDNAPGQQVAHHARTITMSDPAQLKALIEAERPHLVVPEIEAIATPVLEALEAEGVARVIPTARAARLTMDREGIRRLAAETLGLPTSPYQFCDSLAELQSLQRAASQNDASAIKAVFLRHVQGYQPA